MVESLLHTKDLTIGYQPDAALFKGLNLALNRGQLACFMGPNGIGKSTLIRTLAGIQNPLAGQVIGVDSKNVSVVLTDKINAAMMTARDLITYGRYPYVNWSVQLTSLDTAIIDKAIEQIGIKDIQHKPAFELSDGQMQMVMIARALAQDTPVLLLDEPTAHLDLNNRVEIMNLLRRLAHEQQKAVLVSTHELDLALQTADLIWLATPEKAIDTGIPEDLVLDGAFDRVFQFKGFDLKTGRVKHEAYRETKVQLQGEGPAFLWTKNALERNGYQVVDTAEIKVSFSTEPNYGWTIFHPGRPQTCSSLSEVLELLDEN